MTEVTPETVAEYKAAFRSVFDKWLNDELPLPDKEIGNMATAHALGVVFAAKDAEIERLREALKPFARYAGDAGHIKQRAFLQLLICPLGDEHPDNHVPYFQAARAALNPESAK